MQISIYLKNNSSKYIVLAYLVSFLVIQSYTVTFVLFPTIVVNINFSVISCPLYSRVEAMDVHVESVLLFMLREMRKST